MLHSKREVSVTFKTLEFYSRPQQTKMPVPQNSVRCKKEFVEFSALMSKALKHRGKHRQKYLEDIDQFFCDKIIEITMRQKGYFTEVLDREKAVKTRLQSVLNELRSLEDNNHDLRQKLAAKDVFSHNLSSSPENAS